MYPLRRSQPQRLLSYLIVFTLSFHSIALAADGDGVASSAGDGVASSGGQMPPSANLPRRSAKDSCKAALRWLVTYPDSGFVKRNIRLFNFNAAGTARTIDDLSGSMTSEDTVPFLPLEETEVRLEVTRSLREVRAWTDRYATYATDIETFVRSIGRYEGEDAAAIYARQSLKSTDDTTKEIDARDKRVDEIRLKGRIRIFEEALNNIREESIRRFGFDLTDSADVLKHRTKTLAGPLNDYDMVNMVIEGFLKERFPMTLEFPRGAKIIGKTVSLQRPSSLMVTKSFRDIAELKSFLAKDRARVKRLKRLIELRHLEQAELFSKFQQLRDAIPTGSVRRLVKSLKDEEARRLEVAKTTGIPVVDPKLDPNYEVTYAFKDLVILISKFIHNRDDPKILALRPPEAAIQFINQITHADESKGYIRALSWVDTVRRFVGWFHPISKFVGKIALKIKAPANFWTNLIVIGGGLGGAWAWTSLKAKQVHDYIIYDPVEMAALNYFLEMRALRLAISVPAKSYQDFYSKYQAYAQDKFSDEAAVIAFEYFFGIRKEAKVDPARDTDIPPERYDGYTAEAQEIKKRRDILLKGYATKFGSISGVQNRLGRRQYIVWLSEQIANAASVDIKENLQKFLNPDQAAPVVEVGPAAPEGPMPLVRPTAPTSGDLTIPEHPPGDPAAAPEKPSAAQPAPVAPK